MRPGLVRSLSTVLCVAGLFGLATPAAAETYADRRLAQRLAGEALDLVKAKDYGAALAKFQEADALVSAPTLKVRIARCLDQLGRMREAAERYREVIALELKSNAPKVHHEAREEAVRELAELLAATPKLTVVLSGESKTPVDVLVDGESVGSSLGQPMALDPGIHKVTLDGAGKRIEKPIALERGRSERVLLAIPKPKDEGKSAAPATTTNSTALRVTGFALVGVGGAGLVVGAVSGGLLLKDRGELDRLCADGNCYADDPQTARVAERFNDERIISSAGLIGGSVLGAAGAAVLFLSSGKREEAPQTGRDEGPGGWSLMPLVAPRFVGLAGRF